MRKVDTLIILIDSLTKAERKQISILLGGAGGARDYKTLYDIIVKAKEPSGDKVKELFKAQCPGASFDATVQYLNEKIIEMLLAIHNGSDPTAELLNELRKVRLLYSKSLYSAAIDRLEDIIKTAEEHQCDSVLLIAEKMELEYLARFHYTGMKEKDLFHKHFAVERTLDSLQDTTRQSMILNILQYRMTRIQTSIRSTGELSWLNDLVLRESTLATTSALQKNFELNCNHKLFQANYLIAIGNHKAALDVFEGLYGLFEENRKFWSNPPVRYVAVLEGILDCLRSEGKYDSMPLYINKLEELSKLASNEFRANTECLAFQYRLFPLLDNGRFQDCLSLLERTSPDLKEYGKALSPIRRSELYLYASLVYIGCEDYKSARSLVSGAMMDDSVRFLPLMKTIRLCRLLVYYELGEYDILQSESKSLKRKLASSRENAYKTENFVLWFINSVKIPPLAADRMKLLDKLSSRMEEIANDKYERQLLYIFDFIAWVKSKILKIKLSEAIGQSATCIQD
ncbi:MAG: hypothetical protein ACI3ZP_11320 [Candidatus Cryptobacteroides sp.]